MCFFERHLFFQEKRAPLSFTLSKTVDYVSPWHLLKFTAVKNLSQHQNKVLNKLGLIYFFYLFLYSGLEFTITFLTHHTFEYTAMQQGKMFLVIGKSTIHHSNLDQPVNNILIEISLILFICILSLVNFFLFSIDSIFLFP